MANIGNTYALMSDSPFTQAVANKGFDLAGADKDKVMVLYSPCCRTDVFKVAYIYAAGQLSLKGAECGKIIGAVAVAEK